MSEKCGSELKLFRRPLLHQMLKINHLLTLRSPNANDRRELDHHVGPCDATEVDAFFGRSYLSFVCQAAGSRYGCPTRSKKMFGKNDLVVDNLSRDLDLARGKRDALASDVTTLTAQIAEIEARLSEEKNRRELDRVLGEIEAIKKRIKQTASAFAPVIGELCQAAEMAAAVVPEARELNSFLLSVATEVDTVVEPLLRELDRRADAVRVGHAALDLPCLANEAPTELPKDTNDRLLRIPKWLSRNKEVGQKETAENPRSTAA
jgi:cell division septum initiation protein DivIVA